MKKKPNKLIKFLEDELEYQKKLRSKRGKNKAGSFTGGYYWRDSNACISLLRKMIKEVKK